MKNFENDLFLGEENKIFNDIFNSSEKHQFNTSDSNNNNKKDININDLNFNEEDELKNFAESLNRGEHSEDSSNFIFSQNIPSTQNIDLNKNKYNNSGSNINLLDNYLSRLKNFGFPEIGAITLSENPKEQEKTFKFFDYIILKKANNLDDYQKYKRSNDLFLGDEKKIYNDFFNSSSKEQSNINTNNNNIKSNINIDDLNFNEEDELKNFAESLNCVKIQKNHQIYYFHKIFYLILKLNLNLITILTY